MKKIIFFLFLLLIVPNKISANSNVSFIDVKIGRNYDFFEKVIISNNKNLSLFNKDDLNSEFYSLNEETIYVSKVYGTSNSIDIYNSENKYLTSIPSDGSILIGPSLATEFGIKVGEKKYRGFISFREDNFSFKIINHIDIEQYLKGVVPREIQGLSPIEALKAQAVASRSYAYHSLNKHSKEGYNLCDTTHCQVYGGISAENLFTNEAIEQTRGIVAKYNGLIANTVFHASSGGFTESSEDIWGGKNDYLKGKEDPYSLVSKNSYWNLEISKESLYTILKENGYRISEIQDIKVTNTTNTDRVKEVCINENSEKIVLAGDKFRNLLGTSKIKSTMFKIDSSNQENNSNLFVVDKNKISNVNKIRILSSNKIFDKNDYKYSIIGDNNIIKTVEIKRGNALSKNITISGRGYGHGVGMSQYGAVEMAKQGYAYIDILKYYYSDVDITKINW